MDEAGELVLVCKLEVSRYLLAHIPSWNGQILLLDADGRRLAGREELEAEWLLFVHLELTYEPQMASFGPGKEWMV